MQRTYVYQFEEHTNPYIVSRCLWAAIEAGSGVIPSHSYDEAAKTWSVAGNTENEMEVNAEFLSQLDQRIVGRMSSYTCTMVCLFANGTEAMEDAS